MHSPTGRRCWSSTTCSGRTTLQGPSGQAPPGGTPWLWDSVVAPTCCVSTSPRGCVPVAAGRSRAAWGVALDAGDVRRLGATAYVRRVLPQAVRRRTDPRPAREVAAAYADLVRDLPSTAAPALRAAVVEAALGQVEQLPMRLRGAQLAAVAAAWRALGEDAQALLRLHPAQRKALDAGSYPAWRAVGEAARTRRGARGAVRAARRGVRQARRLPRAARSWPAAGVVPRAAAPPARARPRRLRGVLVLRLQLQPAGDVREGPRAGAVGARRVGRRRGQAGPGARRGAVSSSPAPATTTGCWPARRTSSTT